MNKSRWCLLALCVIFVLLTGCTAPSLFSAIGDFIVGVDDQGNKKPGPAPIDFLGILASAALPGVGGLAVASAGAAYAGWRRASSWKTAFQTTAQVIENGAELGHSAQDLKPHLEAAHTEAGVDKLVAPIVSKLAPDPVTT